MNIGEDIIDPKEFDVPLIATEDDTKEKEKNLHLKELRNLAQNMDEEEFAVLVDYIPIHLITKRIEKEIKEKMDIEERINRMYKDFIEER